MKAVSEDIFLFINQVLKSSVESCLFHENGQKFVTPDFHEIAQSRKSRRPLFSLLLFKVLSFASNLKVIPVGCKSQSFGWSDVSAKFIVEQSSRKE